VMHSFSSGWCAYSLSQRVQLEVLQPYTLSFYASRNPVCNDGGLPKTGFVFVTGGEVQNFTFAVNELGWKKVTYSFTASSTY
jgi:hypothetical protein